MFDSVGWGEILVLVVAGLFILGPERLPDAAAWLGKSVRKIRGFASGARQQLRDEMGPEFDDLRKPLEDLRGLRNFDPRRAAAQHLFDGDTDPLGLDGINGSTKSNGHTSSAIPQPPSTQAPGQRESLEPGEKPPVDPDAT